MCLVVGLFGCSDKDQEKNLSAEQAAVNAVNEANAILEKDSDQINNDKVNTEAISTYRENIEQQKNEASSKVYIPKDMDIVEVVKCTSAVMKSGQGIGIYKVWVGELTKRYALIYPDKSSDYIDGYVSERVSDKLEYLKSKGLDSTLSFKKYYQQNCEH